MRNNFATTVQTPRKWPGREAPHRWRDSEISSTNTERSERYICSGRSERKQGLLRKRGKSPDPAPASEDTSAKSSLGPNWMRIDEQGDDDLSLFSRQLPGAAKQGGMAFVQGAHRGNQDHPAPRSRSNVARSFRRLDHLHDFPPGKGA